MSLFYTISYSGLLCFSLFESFRYQQLDAEEDGSNESKPEYVRQKEDGVGDFRVYSREHGQGAIVVGAYEEHIEDLVNARSLMRGVHRYVHNERRGNKRHKNGRARQELSLF